METNNETNSQRAYNRAKEEGLIRENNYIKFKKTGAHCLKFISDEPFKGKNFKTGNEEEKMRYIFEENGVRKIYETATFSFKDEGGKTIKKLSNFVKSMSDFNYGDLIRAEWKQIVGTPRGVIKLEKADYEEPQSEDIPVIEEEL